MIRKLALFVLLAAIAAAQPVTVYLIPNTHGTVSGWLVNFDVERNYVLNNYLWHLDKVKSDPNYRFAYSEVPNVISLLQLTPERVEETKRLQAEKRFEFSNGFFLEPDTNLSGGEALVQMGVLGLRWYDEVFGLRPRNCWMIDLTGAHRQLPQIVTGLGMDSIFFNRDNPTKAASFWWVSPDGTRTLALVNGSYAELGGGKAGLFTTREPLKDEQFAEIARILEAKRRLQPEQDHLVFAHRHGRLQFAAAARELSHGVSRRVGEAVPRPEAEVCEPQRFRGRSEGGSRSREDAPPRVLRRHLLQLGFVLDQHAGVEAVLPEGRAPAAGGRGAGRCLLARGKDHLPLRGFLLFVGRHAHEHGPQHDLGRVRRHGVQGSQALGCLGPL